MSRTYRIGTRGSKLALVQAGLVKARLEAAYPEDTFETVVISTRGDRETNRAIAAIGDNALFTREIETALLEDRIDLAVHSMKDLPAECPAGLTLAKAWPREDPRDVLVAREGVKSIADLPAGARVATGSPRRDLFLRRLRPDLDIVGIRGNVDTRLRKLYAPQADEPHLDAIVLAAAGLKRLGFDAHILQYVCVEEMLPAANQGQLAIELRAGDAELKAKVDALGDETAETVAVAERSFLREIGADCHQPIGAYAEVTGKTVRLRCMVGVGKHCAFAEVTGDEPEDVARRAAKEIRRQLCGEVVLVGAGPGDPELITVKGLKAIETADAIVYDRLSSDELLKSAKSGCELVYVGKASGNHTLPQDEINALLAKEALSHAKVVRLKGGDPFVFGRGGEEMAYLTARGIRCTVVPGVTSAIAAPASAGIPVTHRGVATGFTVVTAHAKNDEPVCLDYAAMLDEKKTFVFLMGLAHVGEIAAGLVAAGKSAATPAAVIGSATTTAQQSVIGTLSDIAAKVERASVVSPAVLVVGATVALPATLGFPLAGKRYLVPKIGADESKLELLLRAQGAVVDAVEVGRIVPVADALKDVDWSRFTWLAVTSRNGLLAVDERIVREIKAHGLRLAAIGKATAAALAAKGLAADWVAQESTGEGMLRELRMALKPNDAVLHVTAAGGADSLAGLAKDCAYAVVATYRNEAVVLKGTIDLGRYDGAFFTCGSSAKRMYAQAMGATRAYAIGPATRETLRALGVQDIVMAESPSAEALVDAVRP